MNQDEKVLIWEIEGAGYSFKKGYEFLQQLSHGNC